MTARCKAVQAKINELRGFALKKTGLIIDERKVIRDHLAPEGFTDERLELIHQWIVTNIWKYKSPGGRGDVGARIIWEESGRAEAVIVPAVATAPEPEPTSIWSTMTKAQFAAEFYPSEAERRKMYAAANAAVN